MLRSVVGLGEIYSLATLFVAVILIIACPNELLEVVAKRSQSDLTLRTVTGFLDSALESSKHFIFVPSLQCRAALGFPHFILLRGGKGRLAHPRPVDGAGRKATRHLIVYSSVFSLFCYENERTILIKLIVADPLCLRKANQMSH